MRRHRRFCRTQGNIMKARSLPQIDFQPSRANEVAGLALRMNDRHHYEFGIRRATDGGRELYLRYAIGSNRSIAATKPSRMAWCVSEFVAIRNSTDSLMPSANSRFRIWVELKRAILLLKLLGRFQWCLCRHVCYRPGRTAQLRLTLTGLMFVEVTQPPLDDSTLKEAATLPPVTRFSVETAERGLLKTYPYVTRLSTDLPEECRRKWVSFTRDTKLAKCISIFFNPNVAVLFQL
jgi:hypothetical protein